MQSLGQNLVRVVKDTLGAGVANVARVAFFDVRHAGFDYLVPSQLAGKVQPGMRVEVPFGKFGTREGLVVDFPQQPFAGHLKYIAKLIDQEPLIPPATLDLALFAADYYAANPGAVLARTLPPVLRKGDALEDWIYDYEICEQGPGDECSEHSEQEESEKTAKPAKLSRSQQLALERIRLEGGKISVGDAGALGIRSSTLTVLERQGLIRRCQARIGEVEQAVPAGHRLTGEQQKAVAAIKELQPGMALLLDGVTNSGKTEVYAQAAGHILAEGGQTLILVPEIALVDQTARAVQESTGVAPVKLHGSLQHRQRVHAWVAAKTASIVVGTPQTLLTPMDRLQLIVVDEEHATGYKQEQPLAFNVRDLALWYRNHHKIRLVLGSATPSLYTLRHTKSEGIMRIAHQRMRQRQRRSKEPTFSIARLERQDQNSYQYLSREVRDRMQAVLDDDRHVLVLRNRRGFAVELSCRACDWVAQCPNCDIHYSVYHTPKPQLRCFRCDMVADLPAGCPECAGGVRTRGLGTQRLEQELRHHFADTSVLRLDSDIAAGEQELVRDWLRSRQSAPAICVGTQMFSKGHNFERIGLVVAVGMDVLLHSNRERVKENLVQLLYQVAGRTARDGGEGEIVILSSSPDAPLWHAIAGSDYEGFAGSLLGYREEARLPPFTYSAQLFLRMTSEQRLRMLANSTAAFVGETIQKLALPVVMKAPVNPYEGRVERKHVAMIQLLSASRSAIRKLRDMLEQKEDLQFERFMYWDIDPVDHF